MLLQLVNKAKLITLPDIYLRLRALMDAPDYTMAEVALLVGRDPALAARFLRFVNSPLYDRRNKISTVSLAVSMLGSQQIHDIVLSVSVAAAFQGISTKLMDVKRFWQNSCFCAILIKQLAIESRVPGVERLFVIGLLHDIGHLILYTAIPQQAEEALTLARQSNRPLHLVERDLLGFDFAVLGGFMMQQWNLPENFQTIIAQQMQPDKAEHFVVETALLHLSARLTGAALTEEEVEQRLATVDPWIWETTGFAPQQCLESRAIVTEKFAEVAHTIFL